MPANFKVLPWTGWAVTNAQEATQHTIEPETPCLATALTLPRTVARHRSLAGVSQYPNLGFERTYWLVY